MAHLTKFEPWLVISYLDSLRLILPFLILDNHLEKTLRNSGVYYIVDITSLHLVCLMLEGEGHPSAVLSFFAVSIFFVTSSFS